MTAVMTRQTVSANVRAEVARARRPQRDVAADAGIRPTTWYSRMRADDWRVSELRAIADVLGVPLSRLTNLED